MTADHHDQPVRYAIHVRGHLEQRWVGWFDGLTVDRRSDGTTVLSGPVVDQSALHGLLERLRDLGVPLISLTPVDGWGTSSTDAADPQDRDAGQDGARPGHRVQHRVAPVGDGQDDGRDRRRDG